MERIYLSIFGFLFLIEMRYTSCNTIQCPDNCSCVAGANNAIIVDCSRTSLHQIPQDIISSAKFVDLSNNHLTSVENGSFPFLPDWQELFLDKNEIRTIQTGAFQMMPNLTTLQLECNNLTEISGSYFSGLSNLQKLHISDNFIQKLSKDAFHGLHSLQLLKLGGNQLRLILNGTFQNLPELGYLHLQDNLLTVLNYGLFHGLPLLRHVILKGNSLSKVHPQAFLGNPLLSNLDLSQNNFSSIPPLPNITNLQSLNCDNNSISELTVASLKYHRNLTSLFVNSNTISTLDYNIFEYLPDLCDFSCNGNDLSWVDSRTGFYINRTESFDLTGNPWICDYNLRWITDWNFSEDVFGTCHLPYKLSGRPLSSLTITDFYSAPRKLSELPSSYSFTSREALYIVCPVFSFPDATVLWSSKRNNSSERFNGTFVIEGVLAKSFNKSLLFTKPKKSLSGELWCIARNEVGEIALPIKLNYLQTADEGKRKGQNATAPSNLVSEEPKVDSRSFLTYVIISTVLLIVIAFGSYGVFRVHRKLYSGQLDITPSLTIQHKNQKKVCVAILKAQCAGHEICSQ